LVAEAVAAGLDVVDQYVREDYSDYEVPGLHAHELETRTFNSVSDTETPRGILALVRIPSISLSRFTESEWVLVGDDISDPGNAGTMIRSAEAAGATAVVFSGATVDPWSPKVVRASAGAVFHVPVVQVETLHDVKEMGVRLLGTTSHVAIGAAQPVSLYSADVSGCIGLVVGNEAHGLNPDAPIDTWVTIPHAGRSESLNVAMAGTVAVMHIAQARQAR
jgi:TrmH family RNA methyltransferase